VKRHNAPSTHIYTPSDYVNDKLLIPKFAGMYIRDDKSKLTNNYINVFF